MGRPAKFGEDRILDAALAVTAEGGPAAATIAAIAERLGAPSGSLYHRFGSRDLLLATLWTRCVRRFQDGFVAALDAGDAEAAALHTPRWCRGHPAEAAVLLLHRRRDLAAAWPAELAAPLEALNARAADALSAFARAAAPTATAWSSPRWTSPTAPSAATCSTAAPAAGGGRADRHGLPRRPGPVGPERLLLVFTLA
ncbi:TetR/AcrR family transcriptional regulator [Actinomadura luteofluorescens]|uniref:TetR/AcrR family transcriptional regulator n=1 Tax=Actinomadura luteofluorescens TaxID=46163 RepID=UPI003640F9B0